MYAQEVTVSGTVSEQATGETLIGATVMESESGAGTVTNEYGFYALRLAPGDSITLVFSYVGFENIRRTVFLKEDVRLDVELGEGVELQEVEVTANSYREQLNNTQMSVEGISSGETKLIPVLLGEPDILKAIQLKPGIPSGSEGTTGIFVRGGGNDQNLILLDDAVVYNPNHLFGFFSTFNADAVKDLKLYKGGFPAQYGGRLSSVIDVKLKEGNNKKFSGSGGLGLIASRLTLEGPIQKDKSSFIVSGRRTYVDIFTRAINKSNEDDPDFDPIPDYYFYDLNAKVNFELGKTDHLYLSGYFGRDVFGFEGDFFDFDFNWGNATGTLRWNHLFSNRVFSNTTFTYSDYEYEIENRLTGFSSNLSSNIRDASLKTDFYYAASPEHSIRFGAQAILHQFEVGRLQAGSDDGVVSFSAGQNFDGTELALYFGDDWEANDRLKVQAGLRLSGFLNDGETFFGLEPRLALRYIMNDRLSLKGSYARMYQYLHLVANAGATLPTDIWYPSTAQVQPQRSDQVALGGSYLLTPGLFLNSEVFYKKLDRQLEFVDNAEIFANDNLEEEFAVGEGEAYGFEFSIEKKEGRLTGWVGYTLSRTIRENFETIDPEGNFAQSEPFSPIYDRRHDISVVAVYELSRRITLTTSFVFGSGDLRWLPEGRFVYQNVPGSEFQSVTPVYGDRNEYRLPPYNRLDVGFVWHFFPSWGESDLTLNIVNVYDRRNAFFIYLEPEFEEVEDGDGTVFEVPTRIAAKQVSLFPILPSVTWNFKF